MHKVYLFVCVSVCLSVSHFLYFLSFIHSFIRSDLFTTFHNFSFFFLLLGWIFFLHSHIQLYNAYTNIYGNIVNNNIRTSMNERTNALLYKNILLTLYSKGLMLVVCERWVGDGTDCYILTQGSSHDHSGTTSWSWLGCSTVGRWGPKPSVSSWFSLHGHSISNCDWNWSRTDSNWPSDSTDSLTRTNFN